MRLLPARLKNLLYRAFPALDPGRAARRARPLPPQLLLELKGEISRGLGQEVRVGSEKTSLTGVQILFLEGASPVVARLALDASGEERVEENIRALEALARAPWRVEAVASRVPALLLAGRVEGRRFSVETFLRGRPGKEFLEPAPLRERAVASAAAFLAELNRASRREGILAPELWSSHFAPRIAEVGEFVVRHGAGPPYRRLRDLLETELVGKAVPLVFTHGNFWIANLLFDHSGEVRGVIDWDAASPAGLPLADLLYLLVRNDSLLREESLGEAVGRWIDAGLKPARESAHVERHCRELSLSAELLRPLFYYAWIEHLHLHVRHRTSTLERPRWRERNVLNVLARVR